MGSYIRSVSCDISTVAELLVICYQV